LAFEEIGKAWGASASAKGERSVAAEDEDSLTMAVAAAQECLGSTNRALVDNVIFASTTSPFLEKQAAVTVAAATDLRTDISTLDCSGSLRAGTGALTAAANSVGAGNSKKALVAIADCRLGQPGTPFESALGDGAAAQRVLRARGIFNQDSQTTLCEIHTLSSLRDRKGGPRQPFVAARSAKRSRMQHQIFRAQRQRTLQFAPERCNRFLQIRRVRSRQIDQVIRMNHQRHEIVPLPQPLHRFALH